MKDWISIFIAPLQLVLKPFIFLDLYAFNLYIFIDYMVSRPYLLNRLDPASSFPAQIGGSSRRKPPRSFFFNGNQ